MLVFFGVLIVLACVFLGLFVLIQNPKGGGLSATFGGFSNQVMGVRQTTDVLEKGTWLLATIIGGLCLISSFFIPSSSLNTGPVKPRSEQLLNGTQTTPMTLPVTPPANPLNQSTPLPAGKGKKP
ncbi:MAG TPA: preprotein translocase subunit SecG [Chitinophagaceae bacterium]|nr:preprotein translocase subunit SecG [Chitinophagaceae bacterium]